MCVGLASRAHACCHAAESPCYCHAAATNACSGTSNIVFSNGLLGACGLMPGQHMHARPCTCGLHAQPCASRAAPPACLLPASPGAPPDPWSAFGVLHNVSDSVVAVLIPDGAHHSDLMYSTPQDSSALRGARDIIMAHVARWVQQAAVRKQQRPAAAAGTSAV